MSPPRSSPKEMIKVTVELTTTSAEWQDASLMASDLQQSILKHAYEDTNDGRIEVGENFEVTGVKLEYVT